MAATTSACWRDREEGDEKESFIPPVCTSLILIHSRIWWGEAWLGDLLCVALSRSVNHSSLGFSTAPSTQANWSWCLLHLINHLHCAIEIHGAWNSLPTKD